VDRDKAVFFQGTWDITSQLALNGGVRHFTYDNSLEGFYGFGLGHFGGDPGQGLCFGPPSTPFAPCTDLDKEVSGSGNVPRVNLTYKFTPDKMLYATYSKGFRPGGVNRTAVAGVPPYQADFLTNYEIGWKTQWFDHRLRWNGAMYDEEWKDFQFSFLGANSLTIIENGGNARIRGVESELEFAATNALTLSTNFTLLDPRLTQNYCGALGVTNCPDPQAPAGENLPVTPKFKANAVARYAFDTVGNWKPFGQASWIYQTKTTSTLLLAQSQAVGVQPAYGLVDLVAGASQNKTTIQLVITNVADRRAQLTRFVATNPLVDNQAYIIPAQPRTIAIKFGQKF
jgi:iron complex outermembrane recepter protein